MKKPIYNSAPLPFMGKKRRFAREFRNVLKQFPDATLFVDLFGGSGLLSHITKQERPDARVIYNDFDDFHLRLRNIPRTNTLLADIRKFVGRGIPKSQRLPELLHEKILARVAEEEKTGFVDYSTLSTSLLFSSKYATCLKELGKQFFYNTIRQTNYSADGYLEGVEIVKHDYRELFKQFRNAPDVVFLVDPPYLFTEIDVYKCQWKLADYLDVVKCLQGQSYVYFTSSKSQYRVQINGNPFEGAHRREFNVTVNYHSKYTDIMLFKHHSNAV